MRAGGHKAAVRAANRWVSRGHGQNDLLPVFGHSSEWNVICEVWRKTGCKGGVWLTEPLLLEYTEEPLVSSDYIGNPASSTFDATETKVLGDKFAKVFAWYDNEWGFSNRMVDLAVLLAKKG